MLPTSTKTLTTIMVTMSHTSIIVAVWVPDGAAESTLSEKGGPSLRKRKGRRSEGTKAQERELC
jgi:hypothetical protein